MVKAGAFGGAHVKSWDRTWSNPDFEEVYEERRKEEEKRKNEILAKNANATKTTTQQSSTGLLYHSTVSFFSFIWSFSPK